MMEYLWNKRCEWRDKTLNSCYIAFIINIITIAVIYYKLIYNIKIKANVNIVMIKTQNKITRNGTNEIRKGKRKITLLVVVTHRIPT